MKKFLLNGNFAPLAWCVTYFCCPRYLLLVTGVSAWILAALTIIRVISSEARKRYVESKITPHNFKYAERATHAVGRFSGRAAFTRISSSLVLIIILFFAVRHFSVELHPFHTFGKTWWIWFLTLCIVAIHYVQAMPVTVFVAGAPTHKRLQFQERAALKLFPFRVASLIDTSTTGDIPFADGHCFPVIAERWQSAFGAFVDAAMVIIIDLRAPYQHEDDERKIIASSQNEHKTVCMVDNRSDPRIIAGARVALSEDDAIDLAHRRLIPFSEDKDYYVPPF